MHQIDLKNIIWKEGKHYVAWNLNTGVSSFGETKKEALESLQEALDLHLEDVPAFEVQKIEQPVLESLVYNYA